MQYWLDQLRILVADADSRPMEGNTISAMGIISYAHVVGFDCIKVLSRWLKGFGA